MNHCRIGLVLAAVWFATVSATAAPVPAGTNTNTSQGPLSDALGLRDLLPTTAPPVVMKVVMAKEDTIELQHRIFKSFEVDETVKQVQYRTELQERTVQRNGALVKETYTVVVPVEVQVTVKRIVQILDDKVRKESVAVKDCKFFTVTKEGKLEVLEAKKAAPLLKDPTTVLTGASAEVDPRHLELVKPGTLYVVIPQPKPLPPPPPIPDEKPKT